MCVCVCVCIYVCVCVCMHCTYKQWDTSLFIFANRSSYSPASVNHKISVIADTFEYNGVHVE